MPLMPVDKQIKDSNATITQVQEKLENALDFVMTAATEVMAGERAAAMTDLVEAYDVIKSAKEMLDGAKHPYFSSGGVIKDEPL